MHITTSSAATTLDEQATPAEVRAAEAVRRDVQTAQREAQAARSEAQAARREAQAVRDEAQHARDRAEQLKEQIRQQIRADFDAARGAPTQGDVVWPPPPPPPPGTPELGPREPNWDGGIPPGVVETVGIVGVTLVCCVVGFPLARAVGRWIDRRGTTPPVPREVLGRLDAIEQAVESVAVEVERISEGQRFTTRMLSERTHEPAPEFHAPARDAMPVGTAPFNPTAHVPANARRG